MFPSQSSAPPGVLSLSQKDQTVKLRKRQTIERHWGCAIDQTIPMAIKPRATPIRVKAKIGTAVLDAEWWQWSTDLFYKLDELAAMTAGRLAFAQALMQAEVTRRQQDYTNSHRETAELLKSDVVRILAELRERVTLVADDSEGEDESENGEGDLDAGGEEGSTLDDDRAARSAGEHGPDGSEGATTTTATTAQGGIALEGEDGFEHKIKTESDNETGTRRKVTDGELSAFKRRTATPSSRASAPAEEILEEKADIASLRAAAAGLRQQASQREAKAYKLEAEMFERQADERGMS